MSTRLAAVVPLDHEGQRPTGPVYRSIIALDLEGSTRHTNPVKGELRRVMYDLLEYSLEAVAITDDHLERLTDRGDGVLVLVRPHDDVPKTVLLDQLIPLLTALLVEYNARSALRVRLRAVVHAGEVHADARGWYGEAIDVAIRLLDSRPVKRALKQAAAPLVLVISDEIYSGTVSHGYVDASTYFPCARVRVGNRLHGGWVHIAAPVAVPVTNVRARDTVAGVPGSPPHAAANGKAEYPVTATHRATGAARADRMAG
jgi:hypothetical protein